MEMLAFAQGDDMQPELGAATDHQLDGDDLRAAILDLAAGSGSTQDALQGYIAGTTPAEEAVTTVHAALAKGASREAVEAALREIVSELGIAAPEPEADPKGSAEANVETELEDEPLPGAAPDTPGGGAPVMHIVTLLEELAELGVQLRCGRREDRLHTTPRSALEARHIAAIRHHKQDIIDLLRGYELEQTGILQNERQVFDEFRRVKAARAAG